MNADLIQKVWQRADSRCEYCQVSAQHYLLPFQIDHIIAQQHGGATDFENLALSCIHCNRFKGPNIAGFDPERQEIVRLFQPRRVFWAEHFQWLGAELAGLTRSEE